MPELPEVETVRRSLVEHILHKKITSIDAPPSKILRPTKNRVATVLLGNHFVDIERVGKLLIFVLDNQQDHILIHLKMTGQLVYVKKLNSIAGGHTLTETDVTNLPHRHTRASIHFVDGSVLYFNDMRMFGYIEQADLTQVHKVKQKFGPELISPEMNQAELIHKLKKVRTTIKAALLNQSLVAGIGNIYADEMCFAARIHPARRANTLTTSEYKKLLNSGRDILLRSIAARGTTFSNFVDGNGSKGNFLSQLLVYGHGGEPCPRCSKILAKSKVAGRGTVFCTTCQS
jgi:formamidopyrimidine-DNA glycosylase